MPIKLSAALLREPIVDANGIITLPWSRFFQSRASTGGDVSTDADAAVLEALGVPPPADVLQSIEDAQVLQQLALSGDPDSVHGASALTATGVIPKVTSPGVLGPSSLTDDGTKVSGTEPLNLDEGATPASSQVALRANGLGALGLMCYAADNIQVQFDYERLGAAVIARDGTVGLFIKTSGRIYFDGASGQTAGTAIGTSGTALTNFGVFDLTTGFWRFGDGTTPAYAVDSAGDIRAAGIYRVGAAPGITGALTLGLTTQVVQYKDWAGANQSVTVVTNVTITANAFTGGIRTT